MSKTDSDSLVEQTAADEPAESAESKKIMGLPAPAFLVAAAIVLIAVALSPANTGITLGFAVTMSLGGALMWFGNKIPFFSFFGGGVILCILVPALFQYFGYFPKNIEELVESFYSTSGFGEFVVAALITGSILGMPRQLLIKAGSRIIVPIISVVAGCYLILGIIGELTGMGAGYALFYVIGPVLAGGVAAGAIPISEIIATQGDQAASFYLSSLVPAVAIANILCIIAAGSLNVIGKKKPDLFPGFNGKGVLARGVKLSAKEREDRLTHTGTAVKAGVTGFLLAGMLFAVSNLLGSFIEALHPYVFLIVICAIIKIFVPMPDYVEEAADLWYVFVANSMIPAILVSLSVVAINIEEVTALLGDPSYMAMTFATVLLAILIAGAVGWLMRLYVLESIVSAGLGLADFGSSGDLAVLQASERLNLLPFLSISSRIGGGIVLLVLSALAPYLL